jgi:mannosyltransferase OCH1-like enzyme
MIPKLFHRIWFGGPEPAGHRQWLRSCQRLHPGWEIRTWTDTNLPPLRNQRRFDEADHPAEMADLARLEMLHRYGGVYLDTDVETLQPLDDALAGIDGFAGFEDDLWIGTAILGAVPGHPLFAAAVEQVALPRPGPINERTGPKFFTRLVNRMALPPEQFRVFPPSAFYPYHFIEPHRAAGPFPGALAVHHWSASWT